MFTPEQLEEMRDQLVKSAGQPKSVTENSESFTRHSLAEQIAALKAVQKLTPKKNGGLRFTKIVPPGA